jgi:hypothetical protein
VRCDWDNLRLLARRELAAQPADTALADLRAALDLVRGEPFAGQHSCIWAEFAKREMISAIVDVADALAARLTETGHPAGARTATARPVRGTGCSANLARNPDAALLGGLGLRAHPALVLVAACWLAV